MAVLIAGLVVFLGIHSVAIFAPGLRASASWQPRGASRQ